MKTMDTIWDELKGYSRWLMFVIVLIGLYLEKIDVEAAFLCMIGLGIWDKLSIIAKIMLDRDKKIL